MTIIINLIEEFLRDTGREEGIDPGPPQAFEEIGQHPSHLHSLLEVEESMHERSHLIMTNACDTTVQDSEDVTHLDS
jgi:hypothetical protein